MVPVVTGTSINSSSGAATIAVICLITMATLSLFFISISTTAAEAAAMAGAAFATNLAIEAPACAAPQGCETRHVGLEGDDGCCSGDNVDGDDNSEITRMIV